MLRPIAFYALPFALAPSALLAQTVDPAPPTEVSAKPAPTSPSARDSRDNRDSRAHNETIVVTGVRRKTEDVLGGVSVLAGQDLTSAIRPSIGDTLTRLPGVSASSFGPTASRPILRGLGGDRIRVLTDGIGSFDVSASSADHAVAINPLTADRIEVLRGPAALPFGSSAIGGVVNVVDSRIPRRIEEPLHVVGLLGYATAANERSAALALSVPVFGNFVLHGDASIRHSNDLRTGGHLLSDDLRDLARASPFADIRALATLKGKLPNTKAKAADFAGGVAYVDGSLNVGLSVTRHTALYGVPIRFSLDPDVEAEAPRIDVEQTRFDARAEVPLSGAFSQVRFRAGAARYHHDELEPDGAVGSSFFARGGEARLDLVQADRSGWEGTTGIQGVTKRVFIIGEEKFLPESRQQQGGIFTLQSLKRGPLRLEAGVRFEHSRLRAEADPDIGNPALKRSFNALSLSAGATHEIGGGWKAGINLARSVRAPSVEELFSNGPHAGTQSFEVGDPDLKTERSLGFEASIKHTTGPLKLTATAYYNRFSNFIYQAPTGDSEDDLPVYTYRQGKADYYGFEVEAEARLGTAMGVDWGAELVADATRATIKGFGPAPQIPPLRLLAALTGSRSTVDGRIEVERVFAQRRNAALETETPGFTVLNLGVDWHPLEQRPDLTLGLTANNILDVVARRHASLLKDYAPLAGRDIRLTASFKY
ncbi:MAG: TonB-dependent receptor [Sphingomonas bacterium]|nr:TonB-dependent receptor [Sphingomonas bacterium]